MKPQKQAVKREFTISEELRSMAADIINKECLDIMGAKIEYLFVTPSISKTVAGKTIKANKEMKFLNNVDYIVEVSTDLYERLDASEQYVLLLNQLLKINPTVNESTGEVDYKLIDSNFKGFRKIISKFDGLSTFDKIKEINSSLNDLTPIDADKFKW